MYQWKLFIGQLLLTWIDQSHQQRMGSIVRMSSYQNSNSHLKMQKDWILFSMFVTRAVWRVKPEKKEDEKWEYLYLKIPRLVKIFKSSWEMTPTRWSYSKWSLRLLSKFQKHWLPSSQQLEVNLRSIHPWRSWTLSPAIMKGLTQGNTYASLMELIQASKKSP